MKSLVIFSSKTGYTERYAKWLSESLSGEMIELKDIKSAHLNNYDSIIYGGGLYASGINGLKKFKKKVQSVNPNKIVVFATGVSPGHKQELEDVKRLNFTYEELEYMQFYYIRGGFDYTRLNIVDKLLMNLLKWKILRKKPEDRTSDDNGMLAVYDRPVDFTMEKNIEEVLKYIRI